ncbi:MAG: hypothetical protein Q7O66_09975 [Dehalococcoidia bacterium]|nr:hypothetical protein [Dehalococcoidia bacterium]
MREEEIPHNPDEGIAAGGQQPKKAYARPAIVYHQPLEAMATVCTDGGAKADGGCSLLYS